MVSLPAVSTGSVAAAHASAEADGATDGAVVAAAVEAVGAAVGAAADGLAPPLVHAVARIANRPRVKVIVLRTSCFLLGCWDARECTCGVPGMPKRRREEARRRFGGGSRGGRRHASATCWIRGSVRSPRVSVGAAKAAGLLHPTQEQELVDLLERPLQVVRRQATDERRQAG